MPSCAAQRDSAPLSYATLLSDRAASCGQPALQDARHATGRASAGDASRAERRGEAKRCEGSLKRAFQQPMLKRRELRAVQSHTLFSAQQPDL